MRTITIVVAAAALALAGCKSTPENGFAVDVTVSADSSIASVASQITGLDISVTGAETFDSVAALTGQLDRGTAKFIYRPLATSGVLSFAITGLDSAGNTLAAGEGSVPLQNGKTVTLSITLHAASNPNDMSLPPDMTCVPETDSEFCARLGKNCEDVTDNDNCGAPRTVTSCGTCSGATPACVKNVCSTPVCGTSFSTAGTAVATGNVSLTGTWDDVLGASSTGDSLLLLHPVTAGTCAGNTNLIIADATTAGSMASYTLTTIQTAAELASFHKTEESMTLTADGLTIIGTDTTDKKFLTSSRAATGSGTFSTAAEGVWTTVNANIPAGGTFSWPVLSADGLAFYYRVGGATTTAQNGIYESIRASTASNFPAGTQMPAAVQAFDAVSGISSDRMTLFVAQNFGTTLLTRTSLSQPFAAPTPAASGPGVAPSASTGTKAWRIIPLAGCNTLIGTCEPGGCLNEDVCIWTKM